MAEVVASETKEENNDATTSPNNNPTTAQVEQESKEGQTENKVPSTDPGSPTDDDATKDNPNVPAAAESNPKKEVGDNKESTAAAAEKKQPSTEAKKSKSLEKKGTTTDMKKKKSFSVKFKNFVKKMIPKHKNVSLYHLSVLIGELY